MEEAAATAVPLPDEVLRKIFLLVKDTVALFRCATACKRWCRLLVSDPSFVRRCLPEDACRSSPFPGFFAQQRRPRGLPEPCFVQGPRPVFGLLDCPRLVGCADSAVDLSRRPHPRPRRRPTSPVQPVDRQVQIAAPSKA